MASRPAWMVSDTVPHARWTHRNEHWEEWGADLLADGIHLTSTEMEWDEVVIPQAQFEHAYTVILSHTFAQFVPGAAFDEAAAASHAGTGTVRSFAYRGFRRIFVGGYMLSDEEALWLASVLGTALAMMRLVREDQPTG